MNYIMQGLLVLCILLVLTGVIIVLAALICRFILISLPLVIVLFCYLIGKHVINN